MILSVRSQAGVLVILFGVAIIVSSLDEGGDDIDPTESSDYEEEDPTPEKPPVPEGMQTLTFRSANLTDEDQHSQHMPLDLKCDGCKAIAYVMTGQLERVQNWYKKGHKLKESDIIDLLENVCNDKDESFNRYGIKEVDKKRRLSGPGLPTKDVAGVLQGGGKWPGRMKAMCLEYIGELGEDVIYEEFISGTKLEDLFCYNPDLGKTCPPRKKKDKKTSKSKDEL